MAPHPRAVAIRIIVIALGPIYIYAYSTTFWGRGLTHKFGAFDSVSMDISVLILLQPQLLFCRRTH